jgi:hypothetical protein
MIFENNVLRRLTTLELPMLLACVALASLWALPLTADTGKISTPAIEMSNAISCDTNGDCEIQYEKLSTQAEDPFLFLGKLVEPGHPRFEAFKEALQRFPNVRTCLLDSEVNSEEPNLLKFDWRRPEGGPELEVCLFRVMSSLGGPGPIYEWLQYHEFKGAPRLSRPRGGNAKPRYENDYVYSLQGTWPVERYRKIRNPQSWLARIAGFEIIYSFTLVIYFSESLKVVHAGVGSNSK